MRSLLLSCNSNPELEIVGTLDVPEEVEPEIQIDTVITLVATFEVGDTTLAVNNSSVIFLYPDTTEYKQMEGEYSEEDLIEVISGMNWYPMAVQDELDSTEFSYTDCSLPHLVFNKADGTSINLSKKKLDGNMIIFNVNSEPIVTYAVSFNKEKHLTYLQTGKLE